MPPRLSLQFFESQECERINYFRNALWLHVNQLSQECVKSDEVRDETTLSWPAFSTTSSLDVP